MADVHTKEIRRVNMQAIKPQDTKPEIMVRKLLKSQGYGYRTHVKGLPGKPDIVLSKYRLTIFIHGCFWHGHSCSVGKLPKSNREYWVPKIIKNIVRDKKNVEMLLDSGWRVLIIRECTLRGKLKLNTSGLITQINKAILSPLDQQLL